MPDDVDAVISDLMSGWPGERGPGRVRSLDRLEGGLVALDYGDEGHALQLTVERVPRRRWTPERPVPIGPVDGVNVELVDVTLDNFVHVRFSAVRTVERDRLTRSYTDALQRWARAQREDRGDPPHQPAERLMRISITVEDDLGTAYGFPAGQAGGTGAEWEAMQSFRPRPPTEVRRLRVTLCAPGRPEVAVRVPL